MIDRIWRKSSHSGNWDGNCVEIAPGAAGVVVRDSKRPEGPELAFGSRQWRGFVRRGADGR